MTREWFDEQLGRMVMLKAMPGDSSEYWRACELIPDVVLERGVSHAIRTRTWFPTPAELLQDCDTARPRTVERPEMREVSKDAYEATIKNPFGGSDLRLMVDREWKYYCAECSDIGQRTWWCGSVEDAGRKPWLMVGHCGHRGEWLMVGHCGHLGEHGSHEYVARCACWASNPELIRKRAADAKYSDTKQAS